MGRNGAAELRPRADEAEEDHSPHAAGFTQRGAGGGLGRRPAWQVTAAGRGAVRTEPDVEAFWYDAATRGGNDRGLHSPLLPARRRRPVPAEADQGAAAFQRQGEGGGDRARHGVGRLRLSHDDVDREPGGGYDRSTRAVDAGHAERIALGRAR